MFVLNKCWTPIEKNAYGDKVKNFKEFKKNKKIEDYIIKIDTEKMTIVKRYVLPGDYYDPFDPRLNLMSFDILDIFLCIALFVLPPQASRNIVVRY